MIATDYIPKENYNMWLSLFKDSGGRFIVTHVYEKNVFVKYKFEDMNAYSEMWENYNRLTTEIRESKRGVFKKTKM